MFINSMHMKDAVKQSCHKNCATFCDSEDVKQDKCLFNEHLHVPLEGKKDLQLWQAVSWVP